MIILILHNFYQQPGGEDIVVEAEAAMLGAAGHRVRVETVSNDAIQGVGARIKTFLHAPYEPARGPWIQMLVERHQPDLIHIHNFFPLLTPAVHEAAARAGIAVVQTLHNYRLLCAGALLMRDDRVCEKCVVGSPLWGVVHRCYRGSLPGSLAVVRMQRRAARRGIWQRQVHRFIALTDFARQQFIQGGLPAERIAVKPNFVSRLPDESAGRRRGALFVGRLSVEKGVDTLLTAWRKLPDIPLTIAGDGPERARLEAAAPPGVVFVGRLSSSDVQAEMQKAQTLIMPSLWYEGFPMTIAEAYAAGLPVIASHLGSMAELVVVGQTGLLFAPGEPARLVDTVRRAFANPGRLAEMGLAARALCESRYTAERNLPLLEEIYRDAMAEVGRVHTATVTNQ